MGSFIERDSFKTVVFDMFKNKAININFEKLFKLSSGVESPLYIEASVLISDSWTRAKVSGALLFWINEQCSLKGAKIDAVVGIAQGGIVWASSIANNKSLPLLYAFARPKDHGLFNQVAGDLREAIRNEDKDTYNVIVVDDAITTGYSAIEVVKALQKGMNGKKVEVLGVYSIFDWNFPDVNQSFKDLGIDKKCLVSVDQLLDYGVDKGHLDVETVERLREYYRNRK